MLEKTIETRKSWTIDQDHAILSIVQEIGTKNWPLVSQLMKEKYQLIARSGKQCRERWHNQLSPSLNKKPWTEDEQQQLFEAHRMFGNRWIQISKQFGGRTDNSIKNHFYSTIRRSMRRICKLLGNRNSTSKLRNIRPSILSEIFQFSKTQQTKSQANDSVDIASCLLQYAREKPRKSSEFDPNSKSDLQDLVKRLIFLNDEYVSYKINRKNNSSDIKKLTKSPSQIKRKFKKYNYSTEQLSETNSSLSQNDQIQKQLSHSSNYLKMQIQQISKNIQNVSEQQNDVVKTIQCDDQIEQFNMIKLNEQNFQTQPGETISWSQIQSQYLMVKSIPIHQIFCIFNSSRCLSEREEECFLNLKQPSFYDFSSEYDEKVQQEHFQ